MLGWVELWLSWGFDNIILIMSLCMCHSRCITLDMSLLMFHTRFLSIFMWNYWFQSGLSAPSEFITFCPLTSWMRLAISRGDFAPKKDFLFVVFLRHIVQIHNEKYERSQIRLHMFRRFSKQIHLHQKIFIDFRRAITKNKKKLRDLSKNAITLSVLRSESSSRTCSW